MKKGVLLVNLGTPESPTAPAVKKYLAQFLGDKRVIDYPRFVWLPILHGIILRVRPKKSAALYQKVWLPEGSPLMLYTKRQTQNLQDILPDYLVSYAMTYGKPSIQERLTELATQVDELTIIPLYPQYSDSTVAPIYDQLTTACPTSLKTVRHYDFHDNPAYIQLLAQQLQEQLKKQSVDKILFSYHGVPVSMIKKGDPYQQQCEKTTAAVMKLVGDYPYQLAYQSKFGPSEWLTPATSETLKNFPDQGVKNILMITPGFVADCLETLEEIEEENRGYFMAAGGEEFTYIHPFNDAPEFAEVLKAVIDTQSSE